MLLNTCQCRLDTPLLSKWGSPGDKWVCARAFLGIISAQKLFLGELLTYTNPRPAVEEGTKANLGRAAEGHRNTGLGTALDMQCATGTTTDGFAQVNKHAAELGAVVEGDVLAGASIVVKVQEP